MGQVFNQAVEVRAQLRQAGAWALQGAELLGHDEVRVARQRLQEQAPLPAREGVVVAAGADPGRGHEVVDRRHVVTPFPEGVHRSVEDFLGIALAWSGHDRSPR